MKMLQMFFGLGATVALLGANVAIAEIRSGVDPLTFSVGTGGTSASMSVSFSDAGGFGSEEAHGTCTMTPGGNMPNVILELPVVTSIYAKDSVYGTARVVDTLDTDNVFRSTPPLYTPNRRYLPPPDDGQSSTDPPDGSSTSVVPEPATLLIVGLGIGAVAAMCRRRWKTDNS